jgi:hypothetical protein
VIGYAGEAFYTLRGRPSVFFDEEAWSWVLERQDTLQAAVQAGTARASLRDLDEQLQRLAPGRDFAVVRAHGLAARYRDGEGLTPIRRGDLVRTGVLTYLGPRMPGPFTVCSPWWLLVWA